MSGGSGFANAPLSVNVGAASINVLPANPFRKGLIIVNVGTNYVFLGCEDPAIPNGGIALAQNGVWNMDPYSFFNGDVFAISPSGTTIAIQEFQ